MVDRENNLPITRQAEVLSISRGGVYYLPRPVPEADLVIMRRLDRLHLEQIPVNHGHKRHGRRSFRIRVDGMC